MSDVARRRALRDRPPRHPRAAPGAPARRASPSSSWPSAVKQREAQGADRARSGARGCAQVREEGKLTIAVVGPAVVHTGGGARTWPASSRRGYIRRRVRRQRHRHPRHREQSCTAPRWASALKEGSARHPAATSTTCAPSTPYAAAAPSRPRSRRACSPAALCTVHPRRHAVRAGRQHPRRRPMPSHNRLTAGAAERHVREAAGPASCC